jgi:hypothetical protein
MNRLLSILFGVTLIAPHSARANDTHSADPDRTVEEIVADHQAAIGLIHDIDVTLDIELGARAPRTGTLHFRPEAVWKWTRSGGRERIQWTDLNTPPRADGRPLNRYDMLQDGDTRRELRNWDPGNPQPITPLSQGSVLASIGPSHRMFERDPARYLLFAFSLVTADARWTLAELLRDSPRHMILPPDASDGAEIRRIRFDHPGMNPPAPGAYFEIAVDTAANNFVRRVVAVYPQMESSTGHVDTRFVWEVIRTRDCGNGVFFPLLTEQRNYRGSETTPYFALRVTARNLTLNEELPEEALAFAFPEHAQVMHLPPENGKVRLSLWGADGSPVLEIKSAKDLEAYLDKFPVAGTNSGVIPTYGNSASRQRLLLMNGAVFGAVVIVLWLARKWRRTNKK